MSFSENVIAKYKLVWKFKGVFSEEMQGDCRLPDLGQRRILFQEIIKQSPWEVMTYCPGGSKYQQRGNLEQGEKKHKLILDMEVGFRQGPALQTEKEFSCYLENKGDFLKG